MRNVAETEAALAKTLREVAGAHHTAFAATDGVDPEWPLFYAKELQAPLTQTFPRDFTQSEIVALMLFLEREQTVADPDGSWPEYYAKELVERFLPEEQESLSLYHLPTCPYCLRVRRVIDELGIDIELRDIRSNPEHWEALRAARGRTTVPVLRCDGPDGRSRWMPESADIIAYLRKRFG